MAGLLEERSNSIIETSLTELAFIFFFILLTVSAWKISTANEELEESLKEQQVLQEQVSQLSESLSAATEFLEIADEIDPEQLFQELTAGRAASEKLRTLMQEKGELEQQLNELMEITGSDKSAKELAEKLKQQRELEKLLLSSDDVNSESPLEMVSELIQKYSDTKGQNINLRNKLRDIGNGLDHPPCWADPKTGSIQYVFNVIINEDSVEFKAGWPESRSTQAESNVNISKIPGIYSTNNDLWANTNGLFKESESLKCRHFVRIYDHAESKPAYKKYLSGVENHFYKFLSSRKYKYERTI